MSGFGFCRFSLSPPRVRRKYDRGVVGLCGRATTARELLIEVDSFEGHQNWSSVEDHRNQFAPGVGEARCLWTVFLLTPIVRVWMLAATATVTGQGTSRRGYVTVL